MGEYQGGQELWHSRKRIAELEEMVERQKVLINNLLSDRYDICDYCKHSQPCKGKLCPSYGEFDGEVVSADGVKIADHWICWEYDFGNCDLLKDTPCCGCDFRNHFEWNGKTDVGESL